MTSSCVRNSCRGGKFISSNVFKIMETERKILLALGERKKVAVSPSQTNTSDAELLRDAVRDLFFTSSRDDEITLQLYDADFEDWIDTNKDLSVKHKDKVKVVLNDTQVSSI